MKKFDRKNKGFFILMVGLLIISANVSFGWADEYPSRKITLLVGFPVGGQVDIGARMIKPFWEKYIGGEMIVINKPGALGELAHNQVVTSEPDGYLICSWIVPTSQGPQATRKTTYKNEDFDYIGIQMIDPHVLVARSDDERFKSLNEFIDYAAKNPGMLKASITGTHGEDHLAFLSFNRLFNLDIKPVFFKGSSPSARKALLGKYVDFQVDNTLLFRGYVGKDKPLKILAYMWPERIKSLDPDAPTLEEATGKRFNKEMNRFSSNVVLLFNDRVISLDKLYEKILKDKDKITILPIYAGG
jgi:tripartite-type tricarboxylate transporter receptor subunit TctC